jgi:hypothetical protein
MNTDVTVHHDEELLRIASWRRILMLRFVGAPTIDRLTRVRDEQHALVRRIDGKVAMLTVVAPRAQISFDDETRRSTARLLNEMKGNILVGTQIVLKGGFFASIVRSVMMGVNLLSRPPYPTKVTADPREGVDFVAEHLSRAGFPELPDDILAALESAMDGLRAPD